MFVKKTWHTRGNKRYESYHVVQSYRDEEGTTRHRYLVNLNPLPPRAIKAVDRALKREGDLEEAEAIDYRTGDSLRGAGQMAIWRAWKKTEMEKLLSELTPAQRRSAFAMVAGRITDPCSKLALKERVADTFWARMMSGNRVDEDHLYGTLDGLADSFYSIQNRLSSRHEEDATLLLYDTTTTYFEGRKAEGGAYGESKDHRWDRFQIVVGVVCGQSGLPLAVEVWPGNTADRSTVQSQIEMLRERFGIDSAVFVGDKGMYSEANLDDITAAGYDYIVGLEWHRQRDLLCDLAPRQMNLFDDRGLYEWQEGGVRYVGCLSEERRWRERNRRQQAMQTVKEKLSRLRRTAAKGAYYTEKRLREKVDELLDWEGVRDLWQVGIQPLEEPRSETGKARLQLEFEPDEEAIEKRERMEGKYILQTTVSSEESSPRQVRDHYKRLQQVERGFRHIKNYLKIRPVYHWRWRRIRAHVLVCFLAYYLVKWMEKELRPAGITREVEPLLQHWDRLMLQHSWLETEGQTAHQYEWTRGELGDSIRQELQQAGLWNSLQGYKRGITKKLRQAA